MIRNLIKNILKYSLNAILTLKNLFFTFFTSVILPLLGFFVFSWMLYNQFIRERIPKNIPFITLSEFYFYILLYIICIYLYAIKYILFPKDPNDDIVKIIAFFIKPILLFDQLIKYNRYIYPYYIKLFFAVSETLYGFGKKESVLFVYIFQLFPRIILLSLLIVDIFILKKIENLYYFIILGFIPLCSRYITYSIELMYEGFLQYLEDRYDEVWITMEDTYKTIWNGNEDEYIDIDTVKYHDITVSLIRYIEIKYEICNERREGCKIEYEGIPSCHVHIFKNYRKENNLPNDFKLTQEDYAIIDQTFYRVMPSLINLYIILKDHKEFIKLYYIPKVKVIIYAGYVICWSYVLYKSFPNITNFDMTLKVLEVINKYVEIKEPLSELNIQVDETNEKPF